MKWTGMYLLGYIVLIGGVLAALWKMGVLASIGTTWTVIGVVILIGFGIMIAVSNSGTKENVEMDRNEPGGCSVTLEQRGQVHFMARSRLRCHSPAQPSHRCARMPV